ncbi:MAG: HAMP domain-containing histidine kinase [Bacteroidales bacterium]|nr:HAMP domain-containing histidine kinase [Bacteroidales bacterium]MCB9000116.1 HAMP domain-containing histidine kinase [Bacteroidales bacterium]
MSVSINIYEKKSRWKFLLFLSAVLIGAISLGYTNWLVKQLSAQEKEKVALWAEANRQLISSSIDDNNLNFIFSVIENNNTVPVILTDSAGEIVSYRNLDTTKVNRKNYLIRQLSQMRAENDSLVIDLGDGDRNYIYYSDSNVLKMLTWFPYVQLAVIILFILVSYFAFSYSRKAEQNKVWIGLSKETAHQLGTPTSSLNAWVELLKQEQGSSSIVEELEKDAKRLEKITERFSKIGSKPVLENTDLISTLQNSVNYLKSRSSHKVSFEFDTPKIEIKVPLNESLFEWVVENICKNAIDAMEGDGKIKINVHDNTQIVYIDFSDTGKGIPKSRFKTIFKPGYTTKQRGWGLGLSLSKRIIETYHEGKIFVLSSEPEKGSTFRIVLRK